MQKELPHRQAVSSKDTWRLEHLFASQEAWEKEFSLLSEQIQALPECTLILKDSAQNLLHCLNTTYQLSERLERLYVYAVMHFHEDSTNAFYQTISSRAETLLNHFASATAFLLPAILMIPAEMLEAYLQAEPALAPYTHFLQNIERKRPHTLSQAEEAILAETESIANASQTIFSMLNDADLKFPSILVDGVEIELTKGRYTAFLEQNNRQVRQDAFHTLYKTYQKQKNTLAATYYESVKKDVFYAKVRHYPSALSMALFDDAIPISVYDTLLETVQKYLPLLHRYIALRKKRLQVDTLHLYDLYAPLVPDISYSISYEEAKKTVLSGLAPLGQEYQEKLQKGFDGGWIDVYENIGKRSGAYSWGAFGGHPYVLLNHNDTIHSLFTIAHEMGHALHSDYTWENQPYLYSGHKIFVAEVASTVNEALLMQHLLKTTTDKNLRLYLLNYFLEQFRGTFFRQAMFAEFEKLTHEMVESGDALTCDCLNALYHQLNQKYYGNGLIIDADIDIEWARIPHFYTAFYVYQYATGYSAAITLSQKILSEGQKAVDSYLHFLKRGCSAYSIKLLQDAGVDMTTPAPLEKAMSVFSSILDEMEQES